MLRCVLVLMFLPASLLPAAAQSAPPIHNEVLIKNALVMTVTHGNIQGGSVYIKDGKIAAVGKDVSAPASATVIDADGKYLTPGIIDSHSHIALDDDVNEATSPITPQMMMIDAFDYQDKAVYRALAGGVTTSMLLHGSANMIGGQAIVIKHKYGASRDAMLFPRRAALHKIRQRRKSQTRLWRKGSNALHAHGQFRGAAPGTDRCAGLHARVGRLRRQSKSRRQRR